MTAEAVAAMLDARSIAVVGASARPGSFGARMVAEVVRGDPARGVHLINPRYDEIDGQLCRSSLKDLDAPVDLVLLGVNDDVMVEQLAEAARLGARSAVIFGSAHGAGQREQIRSIARGAGMAVCGAGCMGFVNVTAGIRALGYVERDAIAAGPISLVTHSGSVFSALLRTRRALGYGLAVSSGQELVTTTADYLDYILESTDSRLVALVLETVRDGPRLRATLHRAAEQDVSVVVLPVGGSPLGASMVAAHSGAVAGADAMWEALCADTGVLRVNDLGELTDTLELLALARRPAAAPVAGPQGIATVHDSGAERTLVADLAEVVGVPFAAINDHTRATIEALIDDGLVGSNPLDLWGTGADSRALFAGCLRAMTADPAVAITALAVDLVTEYDGDTSYADAVLDVAATSSSPIVVLTNLASAVDDATAQQLRAAGVPVLEGTRSGLVALRHYLAGARRPVLEAVPPVDTARRDRWRARLARLPELSTVESFALVADYGIATAAVRAAASATEVVAAAAEVGYPVVLKTDEPGAQHKSELGGVVLALADEPSLLAAYTDVSGRLGPRVSVSATAPAGVELSMGLVRDPQLGPLVVLAAGGVLMELLRDRVVALPPVSPATARTRLLGLRVGPLLEGWRGGAAANLDTVVAAVAGVSQLALELGDRLDALDINPILAGPDGAVAVDVLIRLRAASEHPAGPT
jgi:acetate---CoA ligase (ADP-forming)